MRNNEKKQKVKPVKDTRKFRYGTNATILTVGIVVVVVLLNILLVAFDNKISLTVDFSKYKIYELSQQTIDTLNGLEEDVTAYYLAGEQQEGGYVMTLLERYQQHSDFFHVELVDAISNPSLMNRWQEDGTTPGLGSIVFEMGDKFRVVDSYDIGTVDQQTGATTYTAEQKFTNAIIYLKTDDLPVAYLTTGHGEGSMLSGKSLLEQDNYEVSSIDLLTTELNDPEATLIVFAPQQDFAAEEIDKMDAFLDTGGNVQIYFDPALPELPRLENYLSSEWGITRQRVMAIETGEDKLLNLSAFGYGVASMAETASGHEITSNLTAGTRTVLPVTNVLEVADTPPNYVEVSSLVTLSETAVGKAGTEISSLTVEEGDLVGPFDVVVAANKDITTDTNETVTAKMIVSGTATGFDDFTQVSAFGNGELLRNMSGWMQESGDLVSIRPKVAQLDMVAVPAVHVKVWFTVLVIVLPLGILIAGLVIWRRRRFR